MTRLEVELRAATSIADLRHRSSTPALAGTQLRETAAWGPKLLRLHFRMALWICVTVQFPEQSYRPECVVINEHSQPR